MAITIDGSGTITGINAGGLPDGIVDTDMLADSAVSTAKLPSGTILQVVQGEELDDLSFSVSAQNTWKDILSTSITPVAANSNILVMWYTSVSTATINQRGTLRLLRDSTATVGVGNTEGSRLRGSHGSLLLTDFTTYSIPASQNFMDDPTYILGDSITYKLQGGFEQSSGTLYVNRSATDTDVNTFHRGSTCMQLLEVAA